MAPYRQTPSMLYYDLDKASYAHDKHFLDHWAGRSFSAGIARTLRACFAYQTVLINARVAPHFDRNDSLSAMVAMTCTQDSKNGGNVMISGLGR